jgi:urease accessory protein
MMLYTQDFAAPDSLVTDTLALPFESRLKSRQHLLLPTGETVTCSLPTGTCLRHGDKLLLTGDSSLRILAVEAAPEPLLEVRILEGLQFARIAYHLGNRHVKIEIGSDALGSYLRLPPDHVLEEMLCHLGCNPTHIHAHFQPEGGAYDAHTHRHNHTVAPDSRVNSFSSRIHTFT